MLYARRHYKHSAAPKRQPVVTVFEWVGAMITALVLLVVLFSFLIRNVSVDGTSMVPTLQDGDRLVLSRLTKEYQRGDIVVINRYSEEPLIKRIVAMEGDVIEITEGGDFVLNGTVMLEPYIVGEIVQRDITKPVIVPQGHVFVMGDNRSISLDSRMNEIGMVPEEDIVGKAVFRMWPLRTIGGIYDNLEESYTQL